MPGKECAMRKWYVPLTIVGIGGLGAFLLSEPGRKALQWIERYVRWDSQGRLEWNEATEAELQRLQAALSALADTLQSRTGISR